MPTCCTGRGRVGSHSSKPRTARDFDARSALIGIDFSRFESIHNISNFTCLPEHLKNMWPGPTLVLQSHADKQMRMSFPRIVHTRDEFWVIKVCGILTFSYCALPECGRASATNVNKLTDFQYASLLSGAHSLTSMYGANQELFFKGALLPNSRISRWQFTSPFDASSALRSTIVQWGPVYELLGCN